MDAFDQAETLTVRVLAREAAVIFFETLSTEGRLAIRDGMVMLRP